MPTDLVTPDLREVLERHWRDLQACLARPAELDESARALGAMGRRREVESAAMLLRLALAYGGCGFSLRQTSEWAKANGIASLSDVALLKRLRSCDVWMGNLLGAQLARCVPFPDYPGRVRLVSVARAGLRSHAHVPVYLGVSLSAMSVFDLRLAGGDEDS
jgi:hypothetical protein